MSTSSASELLVTCDGVTPKSLVLIVEQKLVVDEVERHDLARRQLERTWWESRLLLESTNSPRISPWNHVPQSVRPAKSGSKALVPPPLNDA